jgi:SAM-dependent methyltransferase
MILDKLLERPVVYTVWQKSHDRKKVQTILREMVVKDGESVLDVGCGPGINADLFRGKRYLGIDINKKYIDYCRRKFGLDFRTLDICNAKIDESGFDWVLMNSFIHHISDEEAKKVLAGIKHNVKIGGQIMIIDLLPPTKANILGRIFVALDRGHFLRTLQEFHDLFSDHFEVEKSYTIRIWFWDMCVFILRYTGKG